MNVIEPVGVLVGAVGVAVVTAGNLIAQAGGASDVAVWAQVTGAGMAVGGLAYIARQFATGNLVHRRQADHAADATKRETALAELVEDGNAREEAYRKLVDRLLNERLES